MILLMINLILISMIISAILIMSALISKKMYMNIKKLSPYECGFNPMKTARIPFSLQFFLIAMLFLIFDIEITLIIPMMLTLNITNKINLMITFTMFMMILITGLVHEWYQKAINWLK